MHSERRNLKQQESPGTHLAFLTQIEYGIEKTLNYLNTEFYNKEQHGIAETYNRCKPVLRFILFQPKND